MKIFLAIVLSLLFLSGTFAQDKYEKAMKTNLEKMDQCRTAEDWINVANNFERIALAENDKWLPYYYSSFSDVIAAFNDTSKTQTDAYLDKAVEMANMADSLEQNNHSLHSSFLLNR